MHLLGEAFIFLLQLLLNFLTGLFLLRFYFQLIKMPFHNPFGQFVVQLTNFAVKPVRRIVPSFGKFDTATLLLAFFTQWILALAVYWIGPMGLLNLAGKTLFAVSITALFGILSIIITGFIGAVLLHCILSWVHPDSPAMSFLYQFTNPVMRYFRKWIPLVSNIDLSPLVFIALAQFLLYLLNVLQQHLLSHLILQSI